MQNLHMFTTILLVILALYWVVLIGSSLWAWVVRYVSSGEKDKMRLSVWLDYNLSDDRYRRLFSSEYKDLRYCKEPTKWAWLFNVLMSSIYICASYLLNLALLAGYGTIVSTTTAFILSICAILKLSKWVYKINSKLSKHTNDKNAHK